MRIRSGPAAGGGKPPTFVAPAVRAAGAFVAVGLVLAFVAVVATARPAGAVPAASLQAAEPLRKSDVIRLLTGSTYSRQEVAAIIRRSCLSFSPTPRDRSDFVSLGATEAIMEAVAACAAPEAVPRLVVSAADTVAGTGDTVSVGARVTRGEAGVSGIRLVLLGGGASDRAAAVTDAGGRASFRVPVGSDPGPLSLEVVAPGLGLSGEISVDVNPPDGGVPAGPPLAGAADAAADAAGEPGTDDAGMREAAETTGSAESADTTGSPDPADIAGTPEREPALADASASSLAARVERASALSREGRYAEAEDLFRRVLRADPGRSDAQLGLARNALRAGDARSAVRWFEVSAREDPESADVWIGLGQARARAGDEEGARTAFERALVLAPGSEAARRGLASLSGLPPIASFVAWGGNTFDNARNAGPRRAELHVWPAEWLELSGRYDNMLNLGAPFLTRGQFDVKGGYGGAAVTYGRTTRYTTRFELGRRTYPTDGATNTLWRLEQEFRFPGDATWTIGGVLSHWWDRDDGFAYTRVGFVPSPGLLIGPAVYYGQTAGSGPPERSPERELRVMLGGEYEWPNGISLAPAIGYGWVNSEAEELGERVREEFSGGLFDAIVRLGIPVGIHDAIELYVRHQAPPGADAFTTLALGFTIGLERSR